MAARKKDDKRVYDQQDKVESIYMAEVMENISRGLISEDQLKKKDEQKDKGKKDRNKLWGRFKKLTESARTSRSARFILSDLSLALEITQSHIMNASDLSSPEPIYELDVPGIPDSVMKEVLRVVKDYGRKELDLVEYGNSIIEEALFDLGWHVTLIMPRSIINDVIRRSVKAAGESYKSSTLFKKPDTMSFLSIEDQNFLATNGIAFTDDIEVLGWSEARKYGRSAKAYGKYMSKLKPAGENVMDITAPSKIDKDDEAFHIKVPYDCWIPIFRPSDPKEIIGGYIAVDPVTGQFVGRYKGKTASDYLDTRIKADTRDGKNNIESIISQVAGELGMSNRTVTSGSELIDEYNNRMEEALLAAVEISGDKEEVKVANSDEVINMLLGRALNKQETRFLFVDASMVNYVAYDVDDHGMGLSLMERTKIFSGYRILLLFAFIYNSLRNAMGTNVLDINIAEDEDNPQETIDLVYEAHAQMIGQRMMNWNSFDHDSVIRSLYDSQTQVRITGDGNWPQSKFESRTEAVNAPRIDMSIEQQLAQYQYNGMHIPPEYINQALAGNFAINQITSNSVYMRVNARRQGVTAWYLTQYLRKSLLWSGRLQAEINEIVKDELNDDISLYSIIESINVKLPEVDRDQFTNQLEDVENYHSLVEACVNYEFNEAFFDTIRTELGIDSPLATLMRDWKELIIGSLMATYRARKGILPELDDLVDPESEVDSYDAIGLRLSNMYESLFEIFSDVSNLEGDTRKKFEVVKQKVKKKTDDILAKMNGGGGEQVDGTPPTDENDVVDEGEDTGTEDDIGGKDDVTE